MDNLMLLSSEFDENGNDLKGFYGNHRGQCLSRKGSAAGINLNRNSKSPSEFFNNVFTPEDLNFSLLPSSGDENKHKFTKSLYIDELEHISAVNLDLLKFLRFEEIENLLCSREDSSRPPQNSILDSKKDVNEIRKLQIMLIDETPAKVISQPISTRPAAPMATSSCEKDPSQSSSSKRKQNLNVTRNEIAEFIDNVEGKNPCRQLVFDSVINYLQPVVVVRKMKETSLTSLSSSSVIIKKKKPIENTHENDSIPSKSFKQRAAKQSRMKSVSSSITTEQSSIHHHPVSYSESKKGSRMISCFCKRTFRSKEAYLNHAKCHTM